jgi:hypothetical protein
MQGSILSFYFQYILTQCTTRYPTREEVWLDAAQRPANEFPHLRVSALVGIFHALFDLKEEPLAALTFVDEGL